ncbi:fibronectin type III domain-containing protein [Hymenobacter metallilatus]|uniref:Fibronectin type-III domain-containing protein n=1 Tax=Hymenobacter metallilatus TaxID=2493666 RepID=A0A428JCW7_9BACT|nr:fibronectin type III domain-containing protein [Hymenobacter metallilatus]RSK29840.1 hypothetical protein EI290_16015 [Hymenobacter metallilatus]
MANQYLDSLAPWPLSTPLPDDAVFMMGVPSEAKEYRIDKSQLLAGAATAGTQAAPLYVQASRTDLLEAVDAGKLTRGTTYQVTGRGVGKLPVVLQAVSRTQLAAIGTRLESNGSVTAIAYNLVTDTDTAIGAGGAELTAQLLNAVVEAGSGITISVVNNKLRISAATVAQPEAPRNPQTDDVSNIFSHSLVAGFPSASEYELEKSTEAAGYSVRIDAYVQNGRVYFPGITGPHGVGTVRSRVVASGSRPAGFSVSNAVAFTGPAEPAATAPSAVTQLDTAAGNGQVVVTVEAPANGGSPILSYRYEYRPTGATSWSVAGTTANLSFPITGLTNGMPYQFRAFATNSIGTSLGGTVVSATPQAAVKDLQFIVDGNSISTEDYATGWHADFEAKVASALAAKTPQQLAAAGLSGGLSFDWNGISGQTSDEMNSVAQDIDTQFDATKRNVVLTIGEPFNIFRPPYATTTAQQGADSFNAYCLNRKAAHPSLGIVALLGFPDNFRDSTNATYYPPRADFPQVMAECVNILQAKKTAGTAGFDVLTLVDPAYDATNPELSGDGVHPTVAGYGAGGNLINRLVAGIMQYLFGTAQPSPVQPPAQAGNYAAGAQAVTYPTQVNQVIQAGVITSAATAAGYGATGLSGYKLPAGGTGWVGSKITAGAQDAIVGVNTDNSRVGYAAMEAAVWRSSDGKIYVVDNGGAATDTGFTVAVGNFLRLYRNGTVLKAQKSTDGSSWTDVYTYTYASAADLYLVSDIEKSGKLTYPQGAGLVLATSDTNVTLIPGATALSASSTFVQQTDAKIVATTGKPFGFYGGAGLTNMKMVGDGWVAMKLSQPDAFDAVLGLKTTNTIEFDSNGNFYTNFQAGIWNASYDAGGGDGKFLYAFDGGNGVALNQSGSLGLFARLRRAGSVIYSEISVDGGSSWVLKRTHTSNSSNILYVAVDISGPGAMYHLQGVGLTPA